MVRSEVHRGGIRRDEGQAMVELAIVLPVLLAIAVAIVQLSLAFKSYLTLTDAVRTAARTASVTRDAAKTTSALRAAAADLDPAKLVVPAPVSTWQSGADVTVSASYPFRLEIFGVTVADTTITSMTKERVE